MKLKATGILLLIVWIGFACNQTSQPEVVTDTDSTKNCAPKQGQAAPLAPMAIGMEALYTQAQQIKADIAKGKIIDSTEYMYLHFKTLEPTDANVVTDEFLELAANHEAAFNAIFEHKDEQQKYFNAYVNACLACHSNFCPGPMKRIKKYLI